MESHGMIAFFFLEEDVVSCPIEELATRAGVEGNLIGDPQRPTLLGRWAGEVGCDVRKAMRGVCGSLSIEFSRHRFFKILLPSGGAADVPLDQDPARVFSQALYESAVGLGVPFACLILQPWQYEGEPLQDLVLCMESRDVLGLLEWHAGVLFVRNDLVDLIPAEVPLDTRDVVDLPGGKLVFSNNGWGRWF